MIEIKLTNENFWKLYQGKRTTVRLGWKEYRVGDVVKLVAPSGQQVSSITAVDLIQFRDLTPSDAQRDGFKCLAHLAAELEKCYSTKVYQHSRVTVVSFAMGDQG